MNDEEGKKIASALMMLIADHQRWQKESERVIGQMHFDSKLLADKAQYVTEKAIEGAKQDVQSSIDQAVKQALLAQVVAIGNGLRDVNDHTTKLAQELKKQRESSLKMIKNSIFGACGVAVFCTAIFLAWGARNEYMRHQRLVAMGYQEQYQLALKNNIIKSCGEKLCVRLPKKPHRLGDKGEFVVIE